MQIQMARVSISELQETVTRMEKSLGKSRKRIAITLMHSYGDLITRFHHDLNERDELLSRGGALMLIQSAIQKANY